MTALETAKDIAQKIMEDPYYVDLNNDKVDGLAKEIKKCTVPAYQWPLPDINLSSDSNMANVQIIFYELVASSVNYKYWYGKPLIRPNDSNAVKMYETLDKAFKQIIPCINFTDSYCRAVIETFMRLLTEERFPMISERTNHLKELLEPCTHFPSNLRGTHFSRWLSAEIGIIEPNLDLSMNELLVLFPGFAQDIFLKRASLFFMQLYRRKGWLKEEINKLVLPADYHIPNILRYFGCISYPPGVKNDLWEHKPVPEGSVLECEIRAAVIMVAEKMKEKGVNPVQLDDYLWANKKLATTPFHLTITTNY